VWVEYPLFEMLMTRSVLNFRFFQIFGIYAMYNEVSWEWDPCPNMKFSCVSHIPYAIACIRLPAIQCSLIVTHCTRSAVGTFHLYDHVCAQNILDFEGTLYTCLKIS
jgi:hypothetical protein